jgi:hypothetical protein
MSKTHKHVNAGFGGAAGVVVVLVGAEADPSLPPQPCRTNPKENRRTPNDCLMLDI